MGYSQYFFNNYKWSTTFTMSQYIIHVLFCYFSVTQSCLPFCDHMDCCMPGFPVLPRVHPNPCPLSRWCHPTISSSAVPFSSCLQSFPASGSFLMSQLLTSGGQSIGSFSFSISASHEYSRLIFFRISYFDLLNSPRAS